MILVERGSLGRELTFRFLKKRFHTFVHHYIIYLPVSDLEFSDFFKTWIRHFEEPVSNYYKNIGHRINQYTSYYFVDNGTQDCVALYCNCRLFSQNPIQFSFRLKKRLLLWLENSTLKGCRIPSRRVKPAIALIDRSVRACEPD